METNNNPEEFDPATAWMRNVEEVSRRFSDDPESFAANYPDMFRELVDTRNQMAINDPMVFIGLIKLNIQLLPEAIEAAQRGIIADKIRKLTELQFTIQDMLIPKIPVHETIHIYIHKHEQVLKAYLLHVLDLKQKLIITTPSNELTERERALIYCYKQLPPIKRGEPMYGDYLKLCTPKNRIAYPNESKNTAKFLIKSIEKILPFLTESEKQQAENEIQTIKANFS